MLYADDGKSGSTSSRRSHSHCYRFASVVLRFRFWNSGDRRSAHNNNNNDDTTKFIACEHRGSEVKNLDAAGRKPDGLANSHVLFGCGGHG